MHIGIEQRLGLTCEGLLLPMQLGGPVVMHNRRFHMFIIAAADPNSFRENVFAGAVLLTETVLASLGSTTTSKDLRIPRHGWQC